MARCGTSQRRRRKLDTQADERRDTRPGRETWIEAGFLELADGGIDRVKVEVLARRINVTKGGFYWHFRDRADLLTSMLTRWSEGRTTAIARQTEAAGGDARARLRGLIRLYVENANPRGMAIEMAVRDWARRDQRAASAVAMVDTARLERVCGLFRDLGLNEEVASARAFLFYSFIFGQALLLPPGGEEARRRLTDACTGLLVD
ncbi:TetR/AcrR family transcriptional regulator [Arenibaculum sp.]|uniref:TetR/AcrR family transcriptional regulator n=1 Tax=Arenibaculum sp. TaxID=2865862 RepID=UPI002E15FC88|nr:TetR/AcrR family transcriptional regulator [Arenibaculum sp.]